MKKYFGLFAFVVLLATSAIAQTATISGTVKDIETEEALVGATVRLFQDSNMVAGAYTDDEGKYEFEAEPGTYRLLFSYISYDNKEIKDIVLAEGQALVQDMTMGFDENDEGEKNKVTIIEKVERNTEGNLIGLQRRSTSVVDVISFDQVQRAGDADAGSAMKRVTGVTVEGGKYVYVRGLGDRYSKTLLNGSEVPSLDPNRNSVQMDMFPSNLIDNIVVFKTFSPELPGSFTGGLLKVSTKDFPQSFTLNYNSTFGFNTAASFRDDFITGQRGKTDWLGMDDGTRAMPTEMGVSGSLPSLSFADPVKANAIDAASKSFATPIYPTNSNSSLNHSHTFSIGDQKTLFGRPFGYVAGLSYRKTDNFNEDAIEGRWQLTSNIDQSNGLNKQMYLNGSQASREVLWGALVNFSYLASLNHQFSFNYLHNQSGNSSARFMQGDIPRDDPRIVFQTRVTSYTERALDMFQLKGDHTFGKLKADWIGAYSFSSQNEPDLRFFSNDFTKEDSVYDIQRALYSAPSRYFRTMKENNIDGKLNFTLPFKQWAGEEAKFRFGGAYTYKDRKFFERRFDFSNGSPDVIQYNGNPAEYFAPENMGVIGTDANGLYQYGIYVNDASELRNSYTGNQNIMATYAMVELPLMKKLRLVTGARLETTDILLTSKDPNQAPGQLDNLDVLPSLNFIYALSKPDAMRNIMNLRASYARTLARPVFRELAPFASFDFVGDMVLVGNPDLQRTQIDNFDFRWELFPTTRELISVSAFYKDFTNPIELVINPIAANIEGNYRNVPEAQLFGLEFEFRKSLSFISEGLKNFRASGNLTLIKSQLDINEGELQQIRSLNPEAAATRPMFGQSPYSVNGEISYVNDSLGLNTGINFNMFGPRIAAVSRGGTPNIYEQPRPTLDFSIGKAIGNWSIRLRARNLFDPKFEKVQTLKDVDYIFSSYRIGRTFSLGLSYTIR